MQHASQMRQFFDGEEGGRSRVATEKALSSLQRTVSSSSSGASDSARAYQQAANLPRAPSTSDRAATLSTPPRQSHRPHSIPRHSTVHTIDDSDDSNDSSMSVTKQRQGDLDERRAMRGVVSPARPKPSLDEIMQMHSRQSRRVSESDDSDDSSDESLRVSGASLLLLERVFDVLTRRNRRFLL